MNQMKKKIGETPSVRNPNQPPPSIVPAMKRKREVESFQRTLLQKNQAPILLDRSKVPSITVPEKIKAGLETSSNKRLPSDTALNIKESVQKFTQNYKKNTTSKDFQVNNSANTRETKDSTFDKKAKPVLNVKKLPTISGVQKSIEETLKEIALFERKREPLLTDLTNLFEELDDKTNPLLRESEEKIETVKLSIAKMSEEHRNRMRNVTERLKNLREERISLSAMLEDKKRANLELSAEKEKRHNELLRINQSITECKLNFDELLKKNSDLDRYINNIENKITNTKNMVKERCAQYNQEQSKVMTIQEKIHIKQQSIRSVILIRQNSSHVDSESFYKFSINDPKRLQLEITQDGKWNPSKFYDHDSMFYVDHHQQSYDELFQNQDENTFRNILTTAIHTETRNNFLFNIFSQDNYNFRVFGSFMKILSKEFITKSETPLQIFFVKFAADGSIIEQNSEEYTEELFASGKIKSEDEYELVTFEAYIDGFLTKKRFSFLLSDPSKLELIEMVNNAVEKSSLPNTPEGDIVEEVNPLGSENISNLIKKMTNSASTFNILALQSKGADIKYALQFNKLIAALKNSKI